MLKVKVLDLNKQSGGVLASTKIQMVIAAILVEPQSSNTKKWIRAIIPPHQIGQKPPILESSYLVKDPYLIDGNIIFDTTSGNRYLLPKDRKYLSSKHIFKTLFKRVDSDFYVKKYEGISYVQEKEGRSSSLISPPYLNKDNKWVYESETTKRIYSVKLRNANDIFDELLRRKYDRILRTKE